MNDKQKFLDELSKIWTIWLEERDDRYIAIVKYFKRKGVEYSIQVFFTKNNTFYVAIYFYIVNNTVYKKQYDNLDLLLKELKNLIK